MALYGDLMGWNCDPTAANVNLAKNAGTKWIRWGPELPWYLSNPADHTSTLDLAPLAAEIATVHAAGLGCVVTYLGVTTSLNSAANTGNGGWHYFPTDYAKRLAWAAKAASFASLLDPARDYFQIGNEIANVADFNKGDQSPTVVGQALAECILAVRGFLPQVRIILGSLNPIGDINNPPSASHSMPVWGDAMFAGEPRLLTTAKPNLVGIHTYSYGQGAVDYAGSDPLGDKGWLGHVQADAYRQKLVARGYNNPVMCITEMGEPSSPGPEFNESWQLDHATRDFAACDYRVGLGWYGGPQIRHNLVDTSLVIDGNKKFGAFRADRTAKPMGTMLTNRAGTTIGGSTGIPPTADYTWQAGAGFTIDFTDTSTNQPTSWSWTFGDNTTSTLQNPSHTYAAAGTYTTTLVATNAAGSDPTIIYVTVAAAAVPGAAFSYSTSGLAVQFTDTSTGGPTSWAWDFTDNGSTDSTVRNPTFTFPSAGTYTTRLTATNANGNGTTTRTVSVAASIVGTWVYDSAALPFDFAGPFDNPLGGGGGTVAPPGFDAIIELGTPAIPALDPGFFTIGNSQIGGSALLAPDIVWHRLTGIVESGSWHTGLDEERNRPAGGNATFVCRSKNRDLDIGNPFGPYWPHLIERPHIRLTIDGVEQFTGIVENMSSIFDGPTCVTTFTVVDEWSALAQALTWTPGVVERTGNRVARLLAKAGYRGPSFIFPGTVWAQAGTEQSGNIADQIADVVQAEDGLAYFSGDGTFVFLDRTFVNGLLPAHTFTDVLGNGTPCTDTRYGSDTATYWPTVKVRGIEEKAKYVGAGNLDASTRHGDRILELTLPLAFESDRFALASHLVSIYGKFRPRFREVQFEGASALSTTDRYAVLNSTVGTAILVKTTPPLSPFTAIESACIVIGVTGEIAHRHLSIGLTVQQGLNLNELHFFRIDDPTYGVIGGPAVIAP